MPYAAALLLLLLICNAAKAQNAVRWEVPDPVLRFDFDAVRPAPRTVFREDGMARELSLGLALVGRERVTIEAEVPEPGLFDVAMEGAPAAVEVRDVSFRDGRGRAEIVRTIGGLTLQDIRSDVKAELARRLNAAKQVEMEAAKSVSAADMSKYLRDQRVAVPKEKSELRDEYARQKALENLAPQLRQHLESLATRRPRWILPATVAGWPKLAPYELAQAYLRYREFELAEERLKALGVEGNLDGAGFERVLALKLAGADSLASGASLDEKNVSARDAVRALSPLEINAVRNALSARLLIRFFPGVSDDDANSQWFNGQRIAAGGAGLRSIRVHGRIDPAGGDRADWWLVEGYVPDRTLLDVPDDAPVRVERHTFDNPGAAATDPDRSQFALRVVPKGDAAADYSFEFRRAATSATVDVEIHESPPAEKAGFPY